ncbi:MAG: glycoside hydrolase family 55 protein [Kiritimatiellae bacterium]|nr:glycoside hydrolase family 55 protein [Kiritimatiellia bacterium]
MRKSVFVFALALAGAAFAAEPVDVLTLGAKNDGSADVSDVVNAATKTNALYFPPGRYLVEKPLVLCHSIFGKGFSRCPDKTSGDPQLDDTRTWFVSRIACEDGSLAIVSFGDRRNVNVEEVNFMCHSAETAIRVLPGRPGNYAFLSKIGIYRLGGTGVSIECGGSRPIFVQDVCIWGSTEKYFEGSRGILVRSWDCRLSNVEVMAAQIGLELRFGYTYGENLHLWTGCMAKTGDKAAWWKGTRGIKFAENAQFVGSNVYPDTCYHPFEFVGGRCMADVRGVMYWDDRSEHGCEDRNGSLLKCDPGVDPCLKIDGGFWGVCGSDADPHWMKFLYQPKAEIRNVTVRSKMAVKGANLDTLCMNTDLPEYRVSYATNGWCKVAEVFTTEASGSCEGTFTLDDGAAWTLSFLKTPGARATFEARPLNALCAGREIKAIPGDGTLKAFFRAEGPFAGRFVATRMTPRFRPVDWGHLLTHEGAVRYRECRSSLDVVGGVSFNAVR